MYYSPVCRFTHSRRNFHARLACVRHAASVRSEPGSNSQNKLTSFTNFTNFFVLDKDLLISYFSKSNCSTLKHPKYTHLKKNVKRLSKKVLIKKEGLKCPPIFSIILFSLELCCPYLYPAEGPFPLGRLQRRHRHHMLNSRNRPFDCFSPYRKTNSLCPLFSYPTRLLRSRARYIYSLCRPFAGIHSCRKN
jgi:hypothetical protein